MLEGLGPCGLVWAARHSGLVMRHDSPRWLEIRRLNTKPHEALAELKLVFHIFREAHQVRQEEVERLRQPLSELAPLDLLVYGSLFAFEHQIPDLVYGRSQQEVTGVRQPDCPSL